MQEYRACFSFFFYPYAFAHAAVGKNGFRGIFTFLVMFFPALSLNISFWFEGVIRDLIIFDPDHCRSIT